jgi:hypothetical protein
MSNPKLLFSDLAAKNEVDSGWLRLENGDRLHYVVVPSCINSFLIVQLVGKDGSLLGREIISKNEAEALGNEKASLQNVAAYQGKLKACSVERSNAILNDFADDGARGANENAVQTKREAEIGKDRSLLGRIQEFYKPESGCMQFDIEKLHKIEMIPVVKSDGTIKKEPVVMKSYYCVGGRHLLPETYIWTDAKIQICSISYVASETYKRFMFEQTIKSTKFSFGLGVAIGAEASVPTAIGPELGEPVYADGEPIKASEGGAVSFDFAYAKTWARLRIEAEMRVKDTIKEITCLVYPR